MNFEYCTALNHRNRILKESEIDVTPTHEERYISMFSFDNSIYAHIDIAKTVEGFKGNYYCKFLYFDIDSEDLEKGHQMAKDFCLLLYNMLEINPNQLFISFSGNKGFHIGLHQNLFGGFTPAKDLPARIKVLAVRMMMECFEVTMQDIQAHTIQTRKQEYNCIDLSIYNGNRIFRLINSKNAKSNLYKIGLTYEELNTLSLEEIKYLALKPRPEYALPFKPADIRPIQYLKDLWQYALDFDLDGYKPDAKVKSEYGGGTFYPPEVGNRNNDLFKQSALLFDKSNLSEEQVRQLVGIINMAAKQPLPDSELDTIVRSAFKKTLGNKKGKPETEPGKTKAGPENFYDWFTEWADYYTQDRKPFSCIFPVIDTDQEFNLQGRLAAFIGKGGTRKSFYALNVVAMNILNHNARAIYSSMEMGRVEMINRILDVSFPVIENQPASIFYRQQVRRDKEALKQAIKLAARKLSDNLILNNVTNMTTDLYWKELRKVQELYGPVDIIAVDGLSMMGGKGSESERFEGHTKELKDLANQENLFIPLICHTTKDAKQYMRDVTELVRGSGKILDNCDFTMSFSNLINENASTPENITYYTDQAHLKYWNKRGTGLTLNLIYDFCGQSKTITPSNATPMDFMDYDAFIKHYNAKNKPKGGGLSWD